MCYPLFYICTLHMLRDVVNNAPFYLQECRLMYANMLWMCWYEQINCLQYVTVLVLHASVVLLYWGSECVTFCKQEYREIHPQTCLCEWMELKRWNHKLGSVHRVEPFWCICIMKQLVETYNLGNSTYELFSRRVLVNMF